MSRGAVRRLVLAVVFVVVTVAMLRPTPTSMTETLPDNLGDPAFLVWLLTWGGHAVTSDPTSFLDAPIFWDHPDAVAFSEPLLPLVPVHLVLSTATGNEVLALNVVSLGLVVLNLAATFALARRVLGRSDAALVAALGAAFNSYTLGQQAHVQLQTVGFLPLGFLALFTLLERQRARDGVGLALASLAITLSALYYGLIWFVVLGLVLAVEVVRRRGRLGRGLWTGLAVAGVLLAPVLVPLGLVYRSVSAEHGGRRGYDPQTALLPRDLLTAARGNELWGTTLDRFGSLGIPGHHGVFLGLTVYLLGLAGLVTLAAAGWTALRRGRRRPGRWSRPSAASGAAAAPAVGIRPLGVRWNELSYLVVAGVVAGALALGPTPGGVPGPFRIFYHLVPGFDGIRVTSRLVVVALLAGFVVVGLGYVALVERVLPRLRSDRAGPGDLVLRWGVVAVIGGLVLIEAYGPGQVRAEVPDDPARTAVYDELADRPGGPVLELPMADPGRGVVWPYVEAPRMLLAAGDLNPRVNGYSGFFPATYLSDVQVLNRVPAPDALARLDQLGVRYLVVHVGQEQGFPALTEEAADALVRGLPPDSDPVRLGDAWLVDLHPGR